MAQPSVSGRRIVCDGLSFHWPDGTPVLTGLDLALGEGRTGLVGANGSGKSTLLRLVAGELRPTAGALTVSGDVALLRQDLTLRVDATLADLLGIARRRRALHAIESGDPDPAHFAVVGDDWDVEERALAALDRLDLPAGPGALDRRVATLSGGETVLAGLAGVLLSGAPIALLDEPTNNLDAPSRRRLYDAVEAWRGVLVVVSHDRGLLGRTDRTVELRDSTARSFGGPFPAYEQQLAAEQASAERLVRAAEADVRRERRQVVEARVTIERRLRYARTAEANRTVPKIVAGMLERRAQVSAAKLRSVQSGRLDDARAALARAEEAVRDDDAIRIDLPATAVPAGRTVLEIRTGGGALTVRGPERVALVGRNGSGKTTLLRAVLGTTAVPGLDVGSPAVPVGYLPQRPVLDPAPSVLETVRRAAPAATPHEIRAGLARFLLRGAEVERATGSLSGGERFRVALAAVLLADPAPQLLLLDEPTNDLDLASVAQLVDALAGYRGALLVVSHDERFLADVGVTRRWSCDGGLHEVRAG